MRNTYLMAPLQKTFSTKFKEAEKKKNIVQNCVVLR
ncbi:unnamed protein product [Acanthoscelides obtectus]|uniref:Uncharacterized protein n=1 Tax=Acanthoscelides obtectus TaxID=200917 RepID=A0A9P0VP68_ACAOB|nr:unnamed protein product [Acanthoscelides obtectus]CAH2016314.1 unnamed protein product [Acanthoscelides obtectus]CAK1622552.1 hypothetical protein AOBTE_LOCUS1556 [Acanthoscelides obtectus]